MSRHVYLALDSNIITDLTYLDVLAFQQNTTIENVNITGINSETIKRYVDIYKKLISMAEKDEIRLLIVNSVYKEIKHSTNLIRFIKKYCYVPNQNIFNQAERIDKIKKLANAYCEPYTDYQGNLNKAPMQKVYYAIIDSYGPTNDAFIMAEATVENAILLTLNAEHFIFDKRKVGNEKSNDQSRKIGIVQINKNLNYCDENQHLTSKPLSMSEFEHIVFKYGTNEFYDANDDTKIKASTLSK